MNAADLPRLLLVVSNDFGELANAVYFLKEQPFISMLALPPRLHLIHGSSLSVPTQEYRTPDQLLRISEKFGAQVVMLCSGYLFGVNGLFDGSSLATLAAGLQQQGCRVLTTDPFLGLFADPGKLSFSGPPALKDAVLGHFHQVARVLTKSPHLYPARVPQYTQAQNFCFFNPAIISRMLPRQQLPDHVVPLRSDARRWFFVLSAEDCNLQMRKRGPDKFLADLNLKLRETASAGRQPVLVAPAGFISGLEKLVDPAHQAVLLSFCSLHLFQSLLLEAEYAFFWNIYSNSIFHRVANALPVIMFDLGHIAHAIPPLHHRALTIYYGTAPLPMLSQDVPLKPDALNLLAGQQRTPLADTMATYRRLPSPAEVISAILCT